MRVLIYADVGGSGGYVRYLQGLLCSNSIPSNLDVYVIISDSLYKKLPNVDKNVKLIVKHWMDHPKFLKRYVWHLILYPNLVRQLSPDCIFYSYGHIRVFFNKITTVSTCHNLLFFAPDEIRKITDVYEKKYFIDTRKRFVSSYLRSNALIFLSRYSKDVILDDLGKHIPNRIISHGVDEEFRLKLPRSYCFNNDTVEILYVSPIYHYKHQFEVVKAFILLNKISSKKLLLHLVGGGTSTVLKEIVSYISDNNLTNSVRFSQFVDSRQLIDVYKKADIFIFASSCETFGITLLEAMASRLPIACSNLSGLSHLLNDAGLYFDPYDPMSICNTVLELIESEELRTELGNKAFLESMKYSWSKCASDTFNYLYDLNSNEK